MGRRASRRRLRSKQGGRSGRHSDPERYQKHLGEGGEQSGWASLDDQTLLDYAENAGLNDPATVLDAIEVTKRLSSLNVSVLSCGMDPLQLPEGSIVTSDVETIYSELPSATLLDNLPGEVVPVERLKERQCRKRSSKRNRKRTKKVKALPLVHQSPCEIERMAVAHMGKQRRDSYVSKLRYNPIAWVSPSKVPHSSIHRRGSSECQYVPSDISSRALTESDSPTVDDIIMLGPDDSGEEYEETEIGLLSMEGLEGTCGVISLMDSTVSHSQSNSGSELTESSNDSGCEGDDEESSAEIAGNLKVTGTAYATSIGIKSWWDNQTVSSADEMVEDDVHFNQVLSGSFPFFRRGHKWDIGTKVTSNNSEFIHPQQCGIQGKSGTLKKKKKLAPAITTPQELSKRISNFVLYGLETELHLPMLSRALCRTASSLADVHNLDYAVHQKRRLPVASPVLRKTGCTRLASDGEIKDVIKEHGRELLGPTTLCSKKNSRHSLPIRVPVSVLASQKKIVGGNAPPINERNIGNQILRNMGWRPGNGLGAHENGIQDPVFANFRPKLTGLGFPN